MNSLGTRIAVIISVALFSLLLAAGWIIDRQLNRAFMEKNLFHMEMHAQSLLSSLKTLMLNGQGALAREWLDTMRADEDVLAIDILRRDGRPAFSDQSTIEAVNAYLGERRFQAGKTVHPVKEPDATAAFRQALQGRLAFDQSRAAQLTVYAPIRSEPACNTCHGYDDADLRGVFKLSLVSSQNQAQLMEIREELWRIAIALVILLGIILWLALHYGVIRPVRRLRDAIVAVGQGDHETRLPALRHDELGEVGRVFNRMQDQVLETENRARAVMDNVADAILILDEHGEIKTANPAVRTLFGYETDELAGEKLTRLIAEDDGDLVASFLEAGHPGRSGDEQEAVGQRKDGARFPVALSISDMKVGRQHYRIAIIRDITVHKEQVQALEHQALHDDLTGLPNRVLLADRVEHAILSARRNQSSLALLLTDLDHFKEINDTLGHHYGDLILKQVAQRMQKLVRSSDTVARLGGDEFAILLPTADREQARRIVEKMIKAIEQPFELQGKTYILGSSTGIALYPEHGEDGSILLQRADVAMYLAKREHLGYAVYEPDQDQHSVEFLTLKSELRKAIKNRQLVLNYQPVIDMKSGRVTGVEALARWNHPQRGLLMPDEFIPLAEQTGLIRDVTTWVLTEAARQCREWRSLGLELRIAVNLSVYNLYDTRFPEHVVRIIGELGSSRAALRLEITETAIMSGPSNALEILNRLSVQGVRISIDDFGTGYSSLSYLKQLPVDELKIDKSFVTGMAVDNNDSVIVRSTIDLAHNIGLKVVAEGVEDEQTYRLLRGLHCDSAQGFYMSRPLSPEALMTWLRESRWGVGNSSLQ